MSVEPVVRAVIATLTALVCASAPGAETGADDEAPADQADPQQASELDTIPVDEADAPVTEEAAVFDDIIVTATKRALSLREVPATINAFAGEDLERLGAQGVDDIVKLVPGVNINDEGGWGPKRVAVRGITGELQTVFATGVLFGDVPFNDLFFPFVHLDPNPFDLATVEVLKGPHGTLFGGYGLNGMIRYVPEPPKFATSEVKYFVQSTDVDEGGAEPAYGAAWNVPLADDALALRVMGFQRGAPGYTDDAQAGVADVNTLDQTGYRGMLAWEPGPWKLSLMHLGQDTHVADVAWTDNFDGLLERDHAPRRMPADSAYELSSLSIGYSFPWGEFLSQTSHFTKDYQNFLDFSRVANDGAEPVVGNATVIATDAVVQELRLASPAEKESRWQWVVGAFGTPVDFYACVDTQAQAPPVPTASPVPCPENAQEPYIAGQILARVKTTDLAVFGEVTRRLTERWDVTVGARYYRTRLKGRTIASGAVFEDETPGPTVQDPDLEETGTNPRLSSMFRFGEDLRAYLTVSRGFRFGGIQLAGDPLGNDLPDTYESDVLWNYELGARGDWFGRTLQTDAAVYYIDWDRPQLQQRTPDGLFTFTDNVGAARGQGAELAVKYRVPFLGGLSLNVLAAYNETMTTVPFTASNGTPIEPGSPWPYAPRWQTSSTISYVLPLDAWRAAASLRHAYTSSAWSAIDRPAQVFGYQGLDFQIAVSSLAWPWLPDIDISLNNLTNERPVTGATFLQNSDPAVTYLQPRTLIVRIGGRF